MKPLLMMSLLFIILGITFLILSENENNKIYQFSGFSFLITGIIVATAQLILYKKIKSKKINRRY